MSNPGDKSRQPPECEPRFIPHPPEMTERERLILGGTGRWTQCPNLKETSSPSDFDGERYECDVCGKYCRLYYEDMA
ncbi:hypothetical protein [Mesorhizobium sp. M00.F.Ca.ET.217.01.1.1]|uniref:hypothetical protein n=1 Tax=Mesorhizobium sp. M00.F.Ca.ET.217.01.1.1 TaxID=2500529 RepID=UPI000FDAC447|nr:hypothetical protein [Mesorhizobium sp. M00.F.Ca.ET.217.01.1.1]TGQ19275.1 hypothetical protein EN860_019270 [Mesorhizobium sp. M00.F.Ca.ET.217.01.1.1]